LLGNESESSTGIARGGREAAVEKLGFPSILGNLKYYTNKIQKYYCKFRII
jgi:hypothetical protein